MRRPARLWNDLGWNGFFAFQFFVGGMVLSALLHPVFIVALGAQVCSGEFLQGWVSMSEVIQKGVAILVLAFGYGGSAFVSFVGLKRRRCLRAAWVLFTIPVYWLLLSVAAWRAIFKFVTDPHHWEKTEHGLARSPFSIERARAKGQIVRAGVDGRLRRI
jgi:hypothetical protein